MVSVMFHFPRFPKRLECEQVRYGGVCMKIKVVIHPAEEGGYWAEVPSLEGCFAQGESIEDVLADARGAIASHLEALKADGQTPPDSDGIVIATVRITEASAA